MQSLNELENWLITHLPEIASDLNPGATKSDLKIFSSALGVQLPDDFFSLYAWHNGQKMRMNVGPWYG